MRYGRWLAGCALALAGVIVASSVSSAEPPVMFELEFPAEGSPDEFVWDCGDFEIWDDAGVRYRVKETYETSGEFVQVQVHGWFTDRFYNSETGKSVVGSSNAYNFTENVERAAGAWVHHGVMYHAVVPGVGRVLVDAGYFIMQDAWLYDDWRDSITWVRGNHQNIDGDFDALCAVLA